MPRGTRKASEGDIYHVYARGVGHQLLFEDDEDRWFFLSLIEELLGNYDGSLLAWVLMGNHFHLLLHMRLSILSDFMRRLQSRYAQHFNDRYGHVGHVFQGRYGSQPIESDEQLMACVRYIHHNPIKSGVWNDVSYKWNSYPSYLGKSRVTNTDYVLAIFGGKEAFVEFHRCEDDGHYTFIDVDRPDRPRRARLTDEQAIQLGNSYFGEGWRMETAGLPKFERDSRLRKLKEHGLSALQIERLTGIGRNIVNRA